MEKLNFGDSNYFQQADICGFDISISLSYTCVYC